MSGHYCEFPECICANERFCLKTGRFPLAEDRTQPPPNFDPKRLPQNLRLTLETSGVWGPRSLQAAWDLHEADTKSVSKDSEQEK